MRVLTGYGLNGLIRCTVGAELFCLPPDLPVFCPKDTKPLFRRCIRLRSIAYRLFHPTAKYRMRGSLPPLPLYAFVLFLGTGSLFRIRNNKSSCVPIVNNIVYPSAISANYCVDVSSCKRLSGQNY
jgi:hypothetical protein